MAKKYTIKDLQKLAKQKGGECLSDEYTLCLDKYVWQCNKCLYQWYATWNNVQRGTWCPQCAGNIKKDIKYLKKLARKHGGKLLSNKYVNSIFKYKWECGICHHQWHASAANVAKGSWCPKCGNIKKGLSHRKYTIEDMQKLAKKKDGECLSKKYIGMNSKLKWQCNICNCMWSAIPGSIIYDNCWCPGCGQKRANKKLSDHNRIYSIDDMQKLAAQKEGQCLSSEYVNDKIDLQWKCKNDHIWNAPARRILDGSWCPECNKEILRDLNRKFTIKDMQKIAAEKGGQCLSTEYLNNYIKLKWQCERGHIFEMDYGSVQQGSWCFDCVIEDQTLTLEDAQESAKQNGGKCLSKIYISADTKMKWQCEHGHIWETRYGKIRMGQWCPYCLYKTEQKFREVIEKVTGKKFPKKRPKWLVNKAGNRLELDGYNEELGIAFEYQGEQHFEPQSYLKDTKERFAKRRQHDIIKKQLCEQHGIALFCPTYELDEDDFEAYIREELGL